MNESLNSYEAVKSHVDDLNKVFPKYKFSVSKTQHLSWVRSFVMRIDGDHNISVGRISFNTAVPKESTLKHYKPHTYEYVPEDKFFYQYTTYRDYGIIVEIDDLVEEAKRLKLEDIEKKVHWRKSNPKYVTNSKGQKIKKSRKRLESNWVPTFVRLVQQRIKQTLIENNLK